MVFTIIHHSESCYEDRMPARRVTDDKTDRLTITLDGADRAELERLSKETDRSLAWLVRDALRVYLSRIRADRDSKQSG